MNILSSDRRRLTVNRDRAIRWSAVPRCAHVVLVAMLILSSARVAAFDGTPRELVRDTSSRMLAALQAEKDVIEQNNQRLYDLVADIVLPYFDFRRMSQWALGKNWRTATPDQRDRFVEQFRMLLVRTYGRALSEYADEKIIYLPFHSTTTDATVKVRTEIELQGSAPVEISYSMYVNDKGWKVYDVAISGVSLVTNYRSTFSQIIRREGIDSLINQLAKRNGSLTGS